MGSLRSQPSKELNQQHAGEFGERVHQLILEVGIHRGCSRALLLAVVPIFPACSCGGIVADGQPCLREVALFEIVGGCGSAHFCWHPAWIYGIAEDVGPMPCDCERERSDEELAVAIGLGLIPATVGPVDVVQRSVTAAMHAAAQVDQSFWPLDSRGENVRCERVHCEGSGVTFRSRASARDAVDAGIVDYRVHSANCVYLFCHLARVRSSAQVPDGNAGRSLGQIRKCSRALPRSRMQDNLMPIGDQVSGCGKAQPIGAAGDEDTTHASIIREFSEPFEAEEFCRGSGTRAVGDVVLSAVDGSLENQFEQPRYPLPPLPVSYFQQLTAAIIYLTNHGGLRENPCYGFLVVLAVEVSP